MDPREEYLNSRCAECNRGPLPQNGPIADYLSEQYVGALHDVTIKKSNEVADSINVCDGSVFVFYATRGLNYYLRAVFDTYSNPVTLVNALVNQILSENEEDD